MSKSKLNGVDPDLIVTNYGADAARLFMVSDSPPERDFDWTTSGIAGAKKYIDRLYHQLQSVNFSGAETLRLAAFAAAADENHVSSEHGKSFQNASMRPSPPSPMITRSSI